MSMDLEMTSLLNSTSDIDLFLAFPFFSSWTRHIVVPWLLYCPYLVDMSDGKKWWFGKGLVLY